LGRTRSSGKLGGQKRAAEERQQQQWAKKEGRPRVSALRRPALNSDTLEAAKVEEAKRFAEQEGEQRRREEREREREDGAD